MEGGGAFEHTGATPQRWSAVKNEPGWGASSRGTWAAERRTIGECDSKVRKPKRDVHEAKNMALCCQSAVRGACRQDAFRGLRRHGWRAPRKAPQREGGLGRPNPSPCSLPRTSVLVLVLGSGPMSHCWWCWWRWSCWYKQQAGRGTTVQGIVGVQCVHFAQLHAPCSSLCGV
jgi:hypothetical protein